MIWQDIYEWSFPERKFRIVVTKARGQPGDHSAVTEVQLQDVRNLVMSLSKFCKQSSTSDSKVLVNVSYQVFNFINQDHRWILFCFSKVVRSLLGEILS